MIERFNRWQRWAKHPATLPSLTVDGRWAVWVYFFRTKAQAEAAQREAWAEHNAALAKKQAKAPFRGGARFDACNTAEQDFILHAFNTDLMVHRGGWPDFITRDHTGKMVCVEVKRDPADRLSASQMRCAELLEEAGITVQVFRQSDRSQVPWRVQVEGSPHKDAGGKEGRASHEPKTADRRDLPADANPAADERISGAITPSALVH